MSQEIQAIAVEAEVALLEERRGRVRLAESLYEAFRVEKDGEGRAALARASRENAKRLKELCDTLGYARRFHVLCGAFDGQVLS